MLPKPFVEADPAPKYVLVVEDDAVIRMVISELLRESGLFVIEAACSADAISYLRSGAPVNLIFSDIQMAGPLDGLFLARHVQAKYPAIPVILTSGSAQPAALDAAGLFIRKPYSLDRVVALVAQTLRATDRFIT